MKSQQGFSAEELEYLKPSGRTGGVHSGKSMRTCHVPHTEKSIIDINREMPANCIIRYLSQKKVSRALLSFLSRPFSRRNNVKVAIYYWMDQISFSQIYPFLYFEELLTQRYDAEFRFMPTIELLENHREPIAGADIVILQCWFTVEPDSLVKTLDRIVNNSPKVKISFMDSFAHNDLRYAKYIDDYVQFYIKKSLFQDRERYFKTYRGDTNLTDYYEELFGFCAKRVDWQTPRTILNKLRLSPVFFTAPKLMPLFMQVDRLPKAERSIDVHARFSIGKEYNWYAAMRSAALNAVQAISGLNLVVGTGIRWSKFMDELRHSKICLSPFGYGEICWRDVEAILAGCVVLKQDMSHLVTKPDLYQSTETYLPLSWDYTDIDEVVHQILKDENKRLRIAENAFRQIKRYLSKGQFIEDMAFLFQG